MDTMSMRLLGRFSSSLLSAKYPSAAGASPNLRVFCKKVELSFDVLKALEENADSALTGGNVSPVRRKKGRAVTNNRRIDPHPFDSMRIAVPTTDAEVRNVHVRVLSQLQNILEVCWFTANSLSAELNSPRIIFSLSGSPWCLMPSNPRTPGQNNHLRTQHPLRFNR